MGIVFAESSDTNQDKDRGCLYAIESLSEYPDSRNFNCEYIYECESVPLIEIRVKSKNDYTITQFLHNNPQISYDNTVYHSISPIFNTYSFTLNNDSTLFQSLFPELYKDPKLNNDDSRLNNDDSNLFPRLHLTADICKNIVGYDYQYSEHTQSFIASYPRHDYIPAELQRFEEERYVLTKEIMGKHSPPSIQVSEFNILLNDIHCNEGLELYIRNYSTPVCLKSHTYETLLERGFILQRVQS